MIGALPQKIRWMVKAGTEETAALLDVASRAHGFRFTSDASDISVDIPKLLLRRRPATRITGTTSPAEGGTEIHWDLGLEAKRATKYLADIEAALPKETLHYHGLIEVSAAAGLAIEETRTFRALAGNFEADEWVLAIARGKSGDQTSIIVLTDRRLLLVAEGQEYYTLEDAPLASVTATTLGKKSTGETLHISIPPKNLFVTHLGHGEGHGIASTFRLRKQEMCRTRPLLPPDSQKITDSGHSISP